MLKKIRSRLTMVIKDTLFYDHVEHRNVLLWEDCYGQEWMAISKYGFRIPYIRDKTIDNTDNIQV